MTTRPRMRALAAALLTSVAVLPTAADEAKPLALRDMGKVDDVWVLTPEGKKSVPRYPPMAVLRRLEGCAAVAFDIDAQGRTDHVRVLHTYVVGSTYTKNDAIEIDAKDHKRFATAGAGAVMGMRFAPVGERMPLRTYMVLTWTLNELGEPPASGDPLKRHCRIANYSEGGTTPTS